MSGSTRYPLTAQMRDTIDAHGLAWAVRYYAKRLPREQLRVLLVGAHCHR